MRKKKIPGQSAFAQKAHFLKAGPMELSKTAKNRRRLKLDHVQERRVERGQEDAD